MNAKLIVEGQEFDIEILNKNLEKLISSKLKKKTGYEKVEYDELYFYIDAKGNVISDTENGFPTDLDMYNIANYYSDRETAEMDARADKLFRNIRRFAAKANLEDTCDDCWHIYYCINKDGGELLALRHSTAFEIAPFPFRSKNSAMLAIEVFKDELLWYFEEYLPSKR